MIRQAHVINTAEDFGAIIRDERRNMGLTQREVAPVMETQQPHMSNIETGDDVWIGTAIRAAAAFGYNLVLIPFNHPWDDDGKISGRITCPTDSGQISDSDAPASRS